MARTKASVGAKISSGKSSKARCAVAGPPSTAGSSGGSDRSSRGSSGGNPVCPRETPKWQKPITNFFICKDGETSKDISIEDDDQATAGSSKPKRNIIESDDEESLEEPKNTEQTNTNESLDESIILEPLTGEGCHKIDEYYPKNGEKGKGVGKKTKGKENKSFNVERNSKRDRDDIIEDKLSDSEQISKKIKVDEESSLT